MISNWDDNIFNCLRQVNHNLHGNCPLPEKASVLLYNMESCLCSGNGLSEGTAFKACSNVVIDRMLSLLGMGRSIRSIDHTGDTTIVSVSTNPYGIARLYFKIHPQGVMIGSTHGTY